MGKKSRGLVEDLELQLSKQYQLLEWVGLRAALAQSQDNAYWFGFFNKLSAKIWEVIYQLEDLLESAKRI